jgi:hypothetical protein
MPLGPNDVLTRSASVFAAMMFEFRIAAGLVLSLKVCGAARCGTVTALHVGQKMCTRAWLGGGIEYLWDAANSAVVKGVAVHGEWCGAGCWRVRRYENTQLGSNRISQRGSRHTHTPSQSKRQKETQHGHAQGRHACGARARQCRIARHVSAGMHGTSERERDRVGKVPMPNRPFSQNATHAPSLSSKHNATSRGRTDEANKPTHGARNGNANRSHESVAIECIWHKARGRVRMC